jgi:hypothetical protein
VPELLWPKDNAQIITSDNLQRLLGISESLSQQSRPNFDFFLLSQLHIDSEFADVAYFVFLALHRLGRTVDALRTARTWLKGDKVFGYSNVLGVLSALLSHEYFRIDKQMYPIILGILEGDDEPAFRLPEKINLALLHN